MGEADKPVRGLLSKVVRFVTKPTTQWSELDKKPESENPEEQFSKQALKEVMERKRRNDFVRRLEFDQLRKIRHEAHRVDSDEPVVVRSTSNTSAEVLGGSGVSPGGAGDARPVSTLAKINEIEQQMSKQWWIGDKEVPASVVNPAAVSVLQSAPAAISAHVPVEPASTVAAAFMPTTVFDEQVESGRFIHDVDLEEAAVLFANGDTAGAEASLLSLVQQRGTDLMGQLQVWLTLFDLYRAVGDQTKFDFHAIEFAGKYGRSAPVWFSMPEELGVKAKAFDTMGREARQLHWQAPAAISVAALVSLQGNLQRFLPPWTLNWSRVQEIREDAVAPLLALFRSWAEQSDAQVIFVSADKLLTVLEEETPVGDKTVDENRWLLRMATLRLLSLELDFEAAALDYCVTYEVSPPSWADPQLELTSDSGRSTKPAALDSFQLSEIPKESQIGRGQGPQAVFEGVMEGAVEEKLASYTPLVEAGHPFTVRCDRLMRIDFVAAGSVLNWVAECQQKNALVRFSNLHRLNAVFFNLIGINEHSLVVQREN